MAILQIRDLPEDLYDRLRQRAEQERRSLTQEAVVVLEEGLMATRAEGRQRRRLLLAAVVAKPVGLPAKMPDPATLVREDRDR